MADNLSKYHCQLVAAHIQAEMQRHGVGAKAFVSALGHGAFACSINVSDFRPISLKVKSSEHSLYVPPLPNREMICDAVRMAAKSCQGEIAEQLSESRLAEHADAEGWEFLADGTFYGLAGSELKEGGFHA